MDRRARMRMMQSLVNAINHVAFYPPPRRRSFQILPFFLVVVSCWLTAGVESTRLNFWRFEKPGGSFRRSIVDSESGEIFVAGASGFYRLSDTLRQLDYFSFPDSGKANQEGLGGSDGVLDLVPRSGNISGDGRRIVYCKVFDSVVQCGIYGRPTNDIEKIEENSILTVVRFTSVEDQLRFNATNSSISVYAICYFSPSIYLTISADDGNTFSGILRTDLLINTTQQNSSLLTEFSSAVKLLPFPPFAGSNPVRFVHGFQHGGFAYFVVVRRPLSGGQPETRLARVCDADAAAFNSYAEVVLSCRRRSTLRTFYDGALAAHVGPVGPQLAARMDDGGAADSDALYVMYGLDADGGGGKGGGRDGKGSSYGLCVFSMAAVRKAFTDAQLDCYRGSGKIISWMTSSIDGESPRCKEDLATAARIDESFCSSSLNVGIEARYPLAAETFQVIDLHRPTSLATVVYNNRTVALVGTATGLLLKLLIDGQDDSTATLAALEVASATGDLCGDPAARAVTLDPTQLHAYVTTACQVTKVPVKSCRIYEDCSTCVTTPDPLGCGWCDGLCTERPECVSHWTNSSCPPAIHNFWPTSGPVEGGTRVTIFGANFGNSSAGSLSVSAASVECSVVDRNSTSIVCVTGRSVRGPISDLFKVTVADDSRSMVNHDIYGSAISDPLSFNYKVVELLSFAPVVIPRSGGVRLTVQGRNLDTGSSLVVNVANRTCPIVSVSSQVVVCRVPPMLPRGSIGRYGNQTRLPDHGPVIVRLDGARLTPGGEFSYADNPVVTDISPQTSILSGGLKLRVTVTNLYAVHSPRLYVRLPYSTVEFSENCTVGESDSFLTCPSPSLLAAATNLSVAMETFPFTASLRIASSPDVGGRSLKMAAVGSAERQSNLSTLVYVADPFFQDFPGVDHVLQLPVGKTDIVLQGELPDLSGASNAYRVTVGGTDCTIVGLTSTTLTCRVNEPAAVRAGTQNNCLVVEVSVGRFSAVPGCVRFTERGAEFAMSLAVLPVVCLVAAFVLSIAAVCVRQTCRQRRSEKPGVSFVHASSAMTMGKSTIVSRTDWPLRRDATAVQCSDPLLYQLRVADLDPADPLTLAPSTEFGPIRTQQARSDELCQLVHDTGIVISRHRLRLLDVIGQGHFGSVYRGLLTSDKNESELPVAVKTLKHIDDRVMTLTEVRMFLAEALRMTEFDHRHVLHLVGVSFDRQSLPLVILPFMRHGDLLTYIRDQRNSPTVRELMEFGVQIADGMTYLSALKFVHRDLAARNCMLDDNMCIKVADFGLARDIYERDYYSCDNRRNRLPVKWMAVESLEKGIFNSRTDVWSYGIVLWELLTRGVSPYPDVDNWDVIHFLESGRRLARPPFCPKALYKVMLACWHPIPNLRPSFSDLVTAVTAVIVSMQQQQLQQQAVDRDGVTYVNADSSATAVCDPRLEVTAGDLEKLNGKDRCYCDCADSGHEVVWEKQKVVDKRTTAAV